MYILWINNALFLRNVFLYQYIYIYIYIFTVIKTHSNCNNCSYFRYTFVSHYKVNSICIDRDKVKIIIVITRCRKYDCKIRDDVDKIFQIYEVFQSQCAR